MISCKFDSACNLSCVELLPIVEIIQVDRIVRTFGKASRGQDTRFGVSIVVIASDRVIQSTNGVIPKRRAFLRLNPRLKLRVSGFFVGDFWLTSCFGRNII